MTIRSFGWVQNPSDFKKLKQTVEIFSKIRNNTNC